MLSIVVGSKYAATDGQDVPRLVNEYAGHVTIRPGRLCFQSPIAVKDKPVVSPMRFQLAEAEEVGLALGPTRTRVRTSRSLGDGQDKRVGQNRGRSRGLP